MDYFLVGQNWIWSHEQTHAHTHTHTNPYYRRVVYVGFDTTFNILYIQMQMCISLWTLLISNRSNGQSGWWCPFAENLGKFRLRSELNCFHLLWYSQNIAHISKRSEVSCYSIGTSTSTKCTQICTCGHVIIHFPSTQNFHHGDADQYFNIIQIRIHSFIHLTKPVQWSNRNNT